jgi:hypothetical protein
MAMMSGSGQQDRSIEAAKHIHRTNWPQKWAVIESVLGSWTKTAQLCLILIALGISTAVSYGLGLLLWLVVR